MLTLRRAALLLALSLAPRARAQDDLDGIRRPEQLTVGVSDQFQGQLAPDGKRLYFLSNRNTIREVYQQEMDAARAVLLFDEGADVSWARVSPDGRQILYLSFRDDAAGRLCVRDLPEGRRRCLADGARAVEAQWMGPGHIVLVSRAALQGDLRVMQVTVGKELRARPLLDRNLTNPTVSPDGRWLVYVPVQRYVERVGPGFAARAALRLEAARLDRQGPPLPLPLNLPGRTGQPVFSPDGRSLYFVQFLNDSNRDGVTDASDNGVLFRVPFSGGRDDAPQRAAQAVPEQLTDSSWNCQYPSPTVERLITTCAHGADLDVYSLPLDGLVPRGWDAERLRMEIDLSSRPLELQLLYRHLLLRETGASERQKTLMRLVSLHLEVDEFDAAEFYARGLDALSEPTTAGLVPVLRAQIAHRRALRARESGRLGLGFGDQSRERLAALDPEAPGSAAALALRRIVRSEIRDALGDKDGARQELEAAVLSGVEVPGVLEAYYHRADAIYRLLDDAAALWEATRRLADHQALPPDDRLRYARAAVRALVRGLPHAEAQEVLARRRSEARPESELAFALELSQAVQLIRDDRPPRAVRDAIIALYRRQTRFDRQRAVMLDGVGRATELDAERVIEALVQVYIDDVPRGTRERRRAERLYQRFMEGRAYRRLARGRLDGARDDFALVARTTGSFESHVGYIDLLLRQGRRPAEIQAEYDQKIKSRTEAESRFVQAYLRSLQLPGLDDRQHELAAKQVTALLRGQGPAFRAQPMVRTLHAVVLHERFLRSRNLALAQRADGHYLIALEGLRRNPRYRAVVLGQLGLLHAEVGNHRIALGYLQERERIPFVDDASGLLHHLAKARTLLHLDRGEEAVKAAEAALALCSRTPALAPYRVLALDRAALYNLSLGRFGRALQLYDEEVPLLSQAQGVVGERNRLVVRLARAAAALGGDQPRRALADLASFDVQMRAPAPALTSALRWPHAAADEVLRSYRMLAAGLRARAHRSLGELAAAARALETRQALLRQRLERTDLDEDLRALSLVEVQLAGVAEERHEGAEAVRWVRQGLDHADAFVRRTKIPLAAEQLDLLWFAAELRLSAGPKLRIKLSGRLRAAHEQMLAAKDPAWRSYERLFEIYVALIGSARRRPQAAAPGKP